jgi:hypothetical protein
MFGERLVVVFSRLTAELTDANRGTVYQRRI